MDPWANIEADDGTAMTVFCGPTVEYWVSVGGLVYQAACSDDAGLAALQETGHNAWKTVDGQRV
jgi:hypothetical protein